MYRDDAEGIARTAHTALRAAEPALIAVTWVHVFMRGLPMVYRSGWVDISKGRTLPPGAVHAPNEGDARTLLAARLNTTLTPWLLILGGLYQGLQGLAVGALGSALANVMAQGAMQEVREQDKDETLIGWTLHPLDRAAISAMLPLLLVTLRAEGKEASGIL
jgi:hypothetical protein